MSIEQDLAQNGNMAAENADAPVTLKAVEAFSEPAGNMQESQSAFHGQLHLAVPEFASTFIDQKRVRRYWVQLKIVRMFVFIIEIAHVITCPLDGSRDRHRGFGRPNI